MFQIVFLVCSLTAVLGQNCIIEVANCMNATKVKHDATRKAEMEAWKVKAESCFTSNGCTVPVKPTFNFTKNATWTGNNTAMKAIMEKMPTCVKQAASSVETCISTQIGSPFKFPPMLENITGEHRFGGGYHGVPWGQQKGGDHPEGPQGNQGEAHGQMMHHDDVIVKSCNGNNVSANATKICLRGLIPTGSPNLKNIGKHENPFDKVCEAHNSCTTNLNDTCKDQLKKIKAALCTCANMSSTKENFKTCMGGSLPDVQKSNSSMDGSKMFCEDPCAPRAPAPASASASARAPAPAQNLNFGGFSASSKEKLASIQHAKERHS